MTASKRNKTFRSPSEHVVSGACHYLCMTTRHGGRTPAAPGPGGLGWREFLERWNAERLAVTAPEGRERALPEGGSRLGYAPAGAAVTGKGCRVGVA